MFPRASAPLTGVNLQHRGHDGAASCRSNGGGCSLPVIIIGEPQRFEMRFELRIGFILFYPPFY